MPRDAKDGDDDEGKSGGSDRENECDDAKMVSPDNIVSKVVQFFFEDAAFSQTFEQFAETHAPSFDACADEMQLEYTHIYNTFTALFEEKIEAFIVSQGSSVAEFYDLVKTAHDRDPESTLAVYSQMLVATCDFEVFVRMMQRTHETQRYRK
ncbi:hypothetical protein SDRG_10282 [Saprolegnia diclina VS20]|uniref:Cilia- and flagella-associated protein 36 n=1 Tax=Saprolegnia diclina (strain VS20) TaxID=1156394 RepID=T0QBM1_SAPDV|nr:hypothetical protein SDRG_10282 [Saprolegnia diclina VS20]EQC32086.1 hypothetical protein SDRG_10282 [Saprolegnia diclina VS20]|eukprot:XP_008614488.1 hypothetical protein SDRG_10282 [Saprolegnia diclina VS20]